MASINSNTKGKVGEREFAKLLRDYGWDGARRGQQYSGIEGEDVVGLPGYHIEVKRVERLNVSKAMEQSKEDAAPGEIPIVAHRKNRETWKITIDAEQFLEIIGGTKGEDNNE